MCFVDLEKAFDRVPQGPSGHLQLVGGLRGDPGHAGGTVSLGWPGIASGSPQKELDKVAGEREVWVSLLRLLLPRLDSK